MSLVLDPKLRVLKDKLSSVNLVSLIPLWIDSNIPYLLCPCHDNGRGIKCYPCPYVVHKYVRLYERTSHPAMSALLSQIVLIRIL